MTIHWKNAFRRDIESKLIEADIEYSKFRQTNKIVYFQQAGNKLFSIVENYLMMKHNRRVKSYKTLFNLVEHNSHDILLLKEAAQLHYFFYNGELHIPLFEAMNYYNIVRNKIRSRLR